jgi:hypothetical protein
LWEKMEEKLILGKVIKKSGGYEYILILLLSL